MFKRGKIKLKLRVLKSKRVLNGLYQYQLAELIGISQKSYNLKENGKTEFTVTEVIKIIHCLELTLEEANDIFFFENLPKGTVSTKKFQNRN